MKDAPPAYLVLKSKLMPDFKLRYLGNCGCSKDPPKFEFGQFEGTHLSRIDWRAAEQTVGSPRGFIMAAILTSEPENLPCRP